MKTEASELGSLVWTSVWLLVVLLIGGALAGLLLVVFVGPGIRG